MNCLSLELGKPSFHRRVTKLSEGKGVREGEEALVPGNRSVARDQNIFRTLGLRLALQGAVGKYSHYIRRHQHHR